jgi:hypothetical protein
MSRHALPCLVLLLLAAMSVSGCTSPVQTGSGIVIEDFSPGFSEVYPGEPIIFFLKFRNIGSVEATNVFAELLGLDEDWAASSYEMPDNKAEGIYVGGEILPQEVRCRYTSRGNHFILKPPDLFYGTEGETATCTWKYKAPPIPGGFGPTYDVTARVFYDYKTDVAKSFVLMPARELLNYNEQGKTIPASTTSSTSSPITITAESMSPIRFWSDSKISFPLAIKISNTGGGMACLRDGCKKADGQEWNKITLSIKPVSNDISVSSECSQYAGDGDTVEVWPNRDNTIVCNIEVTDFDRIAGHEERVVGITAEYSYFTDAGASIKVL